MSRNEIAATLRRLRAKSGLKADEVGILVGKSGKTVNAWENGRGQPDVDTLILLSDIYGVTDILAESRGANTFMSIGTLIHDRRVELGLTLEEVGNAVGVSKSTVKKWEDGYIENMRRDKIAPLAEILKISPVSLIAGELVQESEKNNYSLSDHEKDIIRAYRALPSLQFAVDRLLGIEEEAVKHEVLA